MLKNIFWLLVTFVTVVGCDSATPIKHDNGISDRGVIKPTQVNAWSAPALVNEWRSRTDNGPNTLDLVSDSDGGFIAAWNQMYNEAHFATHSVAGGTWTAGGPNLSGFTTTFPPRLFTNPKSQVVYAIWYSPDPDRGATYFSRYTPSTGWSPPLIFSDLLYGYDSSVLVGENGEAAFYWSSYADNGTFELNVRRIDAQGNLALLDTRIFNDQGLPTFGLSSLNGVITLSGDVEFYWMSGDQPALPALLLPGPYSGTSLRLWTITLYKAPVNFVRWSEPHVVPGTQLKPDSNIEKLVVTSAGTDDRLVAATVWRSQTGVPDLFLVEKRGGNWRNVAAQSPFSKIEVGMGAVAGSPQGEVLVAWTGLGWDVAGPSATSQVLFAKYDIQNGWSAPVHISNGLSIDIPGVAWGSGYEPRISTGTDGDVVVAWRGLGDPTVSLYVNHFRQTTGWQGEELAVVTSARDSWFQDYKLAVSAGGHATLVWQESQVVAGGFVNYQVKAVDHVGAGNGAVNVKAVAADSKTRQIVGGKTVVPSVTLRNPAVQRLLGQNGASRWVGTKQLPPVRPSIAWDPPQLLDTITTTAGDGQILDNLHVQTNDRNEALVTYMFNPNKPKNAIYSGNLVGGNWKKESPPIAVGQLDSIMGDLAVDPATNNFHLSWGTMCPNLACLDVYVSQRQRDGAWSPSTALGQSRGGGLNLLNNSKHIGASWVYYSDLSTYPKIAYSEYDPKSGWSSPNFYAPTQQKGAVSTQSQVGNFGVNAVLGESGVMSIVTDVFENPTNGSALMIQRDPVSGWRQTSFPGPLAAASDIFLNAPGVADSLQVMVTDGLSSTNLREISYSYANGQWGPQLVATAPKKGDVVRFGPFGLPKDNNTKGQVLLAWSEQIGTQLDYQRQARVNWFDPVKGWGKPVDIGFPVSANVPSLPGLPMMDVIGLMDVSVNESGQGAVAWVDSSGIEQTLNIVHLDSTMSLVQQEIVASTDPALAVISALDVRVDALGRTIVVWEETSFNAADEVHRIKATTHHDKGSMLVQPTLPVQPGPRPVVNVPKASVGWSAAETAWVFPSSINFSGPGYQTGTASVAGRPTFMAQMDLALDPATPDVLTSVRKLASSPAPGVWNEQNPYGTFTPDNLTGVQIASDEKSQSLFALWYSGQRLYTNAQKMQGAWGTPQVVAGHSISASLMSNNFGNVLISSTVATDPSTVTVSEIGVDTTGNVKVFAAKSASVPNTSVASQPVLSSSGLLTVLRRLSGAGGTDFVVSQYVFGKGWRTSSSAPINLAEFAPQSAHLAVTSTQKLMLFAQSEVSRTLKSALLQANGSWGAWQEVQPIDLGNVALVGNYRVGADDNGVLHVMWVQEAIGADGAPHSTVMYSVWNASTSAWQAPTTLTSIRRPSYYDTPKMVVAADGAAAVVWRQPVVLFESEAIMVKKLQAGAGWQLSPDIAAAFDLTAFYGAGSIKPFISSDKQIHLVWYLGGMFDPVSGTAWSVQTTHSPL